MSKMFTKAALGVAAAALLVSGCSTTRTFVDYSGGTLYSTETVGNVPYVEVGPVAASERGFFWNSCWELAEKAAAKLRAQAEQYGANNVTAVRWLNHADGSYTETPICTTGWAWMLAPPVLGGLAPWVKVVEVKGRLVHADEARLAGFRKEVSKRSAAWQEAEAKRIALESMSDDERAAKEAAEKAEAERIAAAKAAEEAAAQKAALEAELAAKLAAERAAAEKAEAERVAAAKATAAAKPAAKKKKKAASATASAPAAQTAPAAGSP